MIKPIFPEHKEQDSSATTVYISYRETITNGETVLVIK